MKMHGLGVILLLLSVAPACAGAYEEKYQDLLEQLPVVPPTDNGWLLLQEFPLKKEPRRDPKQGPLVVFPEQEREDKPMGVNLALLKLSVADNVKLLTLAKTLLQRPGWAFNQSKTLSFFGLADQKLSELTFCCKILLAEATVKAQGGRINPGWMEAVEIMKLGQRMNRAGGVILQTLVGSAQIKLAARHAAWIGQLSQDAATIKLFAKELEAHESLGETFPRTVRGEFRFSLKVIEMYQLGGEPLQRYLVENAARMEELEMAARQGAAAVSIKDGNLSISEKPFPVYPREENIARWMKEPPLSIQQEMEAAKTFNFNSLIEAQAVAFRKGIKDQSTTWADYLKANPKRDVKSVEIASEGFLATLSPIDNSTFGILQEILFSQVVQVRLARVSLLLKAWALGHAGELPDTLSQLVPNYLPALPLDPYDGQVLRYDKARRRIWSVGKDLVDGGTRLDDIVQVVLE